MASADLYLDRIDFLRYLNHEVCIQCGFTSCGEFISAIKTGQRKAGDCPFISRNQANALEAIRKIEQTWPEVPLLLHPRPGYAGLIELNNPSPGSLVLVTGNNEYTGQVLTTVLSTTICPFFVLFVDTDGNTIDMALIYRTFTAERVQKALEETDIGHKATAAHEMIIPGLAGALQNDFEAATGWKVRVGPVCAAELPLFLSEIWVPP